MSNSVVNRTHPSKEKANEKSARLLKWILILATTAGGIGAAITQFIRLPTTQSGLAVTVIGLFLAGGATWISAFVVPGLVYADASTLKSRDLNWNPHPVRLAVGSFLLTIAGGTLLEVIRGPLVSALHPVMTMYANQVLISPVTPTVLLSVTAPMGAVWYLGYRHKHVQSSAPSRYWWLLIPGVVVCALSYLLVPLFMPGDWNLLFVALVAISPLFPIAVYMDACYLCRSANEWNPNPSLQFFVAYLSHLIFPFSPFYPMYAIYYLVRRGNGGRK